MQGQSHLQCLAAAVKLAQLCYTGSDTLSATVDAGLATPLPADFHSHPRLPTMMYHWLAQLHSRICYM
jgi:hypothetical protein